MINKQIATYLDSVLATPELTSEQEKELLEAKALCDSKNFVIPESIESINSMQEIMNNFMNRHPQLMNTPEKIDLQECKFQKLVQDTGLLMKNKPAGRF